MPVGEPLAVLVYDEKDVEAFNHLAPYRPEGAGAGGDGGDGGGNGAAVEPADGTALLKFIHKLVRGGQIKDKGALRRWLVGGGGRVCVLPCLPRLSILPPNLSC